MPTVKHAVIAAAGMGTRLGLGFPKCMYELGGRPLISHLLDRLVEVEDIRVVVGFMEKEVIDVVSKIRQDVIFVRNPAYQTTTTLTSYIMGAENLTEPCLYMDADIFFSPDSFENFLSICSRKSKPYIAITKAKTVDAVFVARNETGAVVGFSRVEASSWEWANLAHLPAGTLQEQPTAVFEQLRSCLPIESIEVESYEIDRGEDLEQAELAYQKDFNG